MDDLMSQIMGKLSQILIMYKGDPDTPILTEAMTGPYKDVFMQSMTQEIKELEHHGTWTIVSRKSVTGVHILSSTWDFKVKRFSGGRPSNLKARICARGDIQVEEVDYLENMPLLSLGLHSDSC